MHATGNPTQWNANYPALEDLEPDIQNGNSYVCVENDKVVATFTLIIGDEPNYPTRIINQCRLALSRMDLKNVGLFTSVTGLRGLLMNLLGYLNRGVFL